MCEKSNASYSVKANRYQMACKIEILLGQVKKAYSEARDNDLRFAPNGTDMDEYQKMFSLFYSLRSEVGEVAINNIVSNEATESHDEFMKSMKAGGPFPIVE